MGKSVIAAVFIHVFVLSMVWVGFPVPLPRNGVIFYYSGSFLPEEISVGRPAARKARGDIVPVGAADAGSFVPWVRMRDLDKPMRP